MTSCGSVSLLTAGAWVGPGPLLGVVTDSSGADRAGFSAHTTISRSAFGVDISIDIQFTTADGAA